MLLHFGIKPYIVFDGDYLPSKSATERERADRRKDSRKNGLDFLRLGKVSQAHRELQKSIDITPEMARQFIDELKKAKIDYVVAPYEADAQMVYLEKRGLIQAILSEDSDLLVFGARCLLTKLDQYGHCIMINRADFTACRDISLVGWTDADFRLMCILSGCDYLASIDKMGLKTAYTLIRKHKTVERIVRAVQFDGKMKVPAGYLDDFAQADATFLYQWVYCSESQSLVNFTEPPANFKLSDFPCIGSSVEPSIAAGVAKGHLHPHTKEPLVPTHTIQATPRPVLRNLATTSTPNLKGIQSIESFFKRPTRTPLAELDPNMFTPSPSQQQLLQRPSATWSATPILRQPLLARHSSLAPASAPPQLRRAVTGPPPPLSQSPKRQRLCADGYFAVPLSESAKKLEAVPSRFFASKASPSVARDRRKGRNDGNEFNLWSDDSVEDAMLQLSDATSSQSTKPSSSKKMAVFKDEVKTPGTEAVPALFKDEEAAAEPKAQPARSIFTSGLATSVANLSQFKYAADRGVRKEATTVTGRASAPSSPTRTVSHELERGDRNKATTQDDFDELDWDEAESRPLSCVEEHGEKVAGLEKGVHQAGEDQVVQDSDGQKAGPKGSEDQIIPDSDSEAEEVTQHTGFSFDLGKFAFAA